MEYKDPIEIQRVKENILNSALLIGVILGALVLGLSIGHLKQSQTYWGFISDATLLVLFSTIWIFRHKINILLRGYGILVGVFIFIFMDIYRGGLFAGNLVLLILVPLLCFLVFSNRLNIIFSLLAVLFYFIFCWLFTSGILDNTDKFDDRLRSPVDWLLSILLISVVAAAVVILVGQFNRTFLRLIEDLKTQNRELQDYRDRLLNMVSEKTANLEMANEELEASNEELAKNSLVIEKKNKKLKATLKHLKETQSQLLETEKMASLGTLTAGVAHEINNPLNFIMGAYMGLEDFFKEKAPAYKKEVAPFLNGMKSGVDRASDIVLGLNQFSRNTDDFNEDCDIHKILDSCIYMLHHQSLNRISIHKNYLPDFIKLKGNVGKLHQAFINILSNAIQSIDEKGSISIRTGLSPGELLISVTDTGCGIESSILPKITDPFYTTKDPGKGTGLGLAITNRIILEHKGKLLFKSEVGKGTRVNVALPYKQNA